MSVKRMASLLISLLLLVNPSLGILAEGLEEETQNEMQTIGVEVNAPDDQGNPVVTQTVDGIDVKENYGGSLMGASVNASGENGNSDVSAVLNVEGNVAVTNEFSEEVTYLVDDQTESYTNTGNATGISAGSSNAETDVKVDGNVTVEATGNATGVSATSGNEGSTDVQTGEVTVTSSGGEATGVSAGSSNAETDVKVDGNVAVEATGNATGVDANSRNGGSTDVITENITVTSSSDDGSAHASGISGYGTDTSVIAGDINVSIEQKEYANAYGVDNPERSYIDNTPGKTVPDKNIEIVTENIRAEATSENADAAAYGVRTSQLISSDPNPDSRAADWVSGNAQSNKTTVNGSIEATATAKGDEGSASAIGIYERQDAESLQTGKTESQSAEIKVAGDISAIASGTGRTSAYGLFAESTSIYATGKKEAESDLTQRLDVTVKGKISAEATSVKPQEDEYNDTRAAGVYLRVTETDVDISVEKDISAEAKSVSGSSVYGIYAENEQNASIDITANGNITASLADSDINGESAAIGVLSRADQNGKNTIKVGGNVTATASGEAKVPVYTKYATEDPETGSDKLSGMSDVEIGGNVTASTESKSIFGYAVGVYVEAEGNQKESAANEEDGIRSTAEEAEKEVSAIGVNSRGIDSAVTVLGDIQVKMDGTSGFAYGVDVISENDGNATVDIRGGIEVVGNFSDPEDSVAAGIVAYMEGDGNVAVSVDGDVKATSTGIAVMMSEGSSGNVDVFVGGDVTGTEDTALLIWKAEDSDAVAKLIVEGTLSGGEVAVLVEPTVTKNDVDLTVWKVDLTQVGDEAHAVVTYNDENLAVTDVTREIEEDIRYIIKVQANANGNVELEGTEKVDGYDTAKEGDSVVMKINANAGYHVTAAYNGDGQQVPLLKDINGNYYVIVPRGGGVYLSAVIDHDADENSGDDGSTGSSEGKKRAVIVRPDDENTGDKLFEQSVSEKDMQTLSRFSPDQQVAIILTKLGLREILTASGIKIKPLALEAVKSIQSDLKYLIVDNLLSLDGETDLWHVITIVENETGNTISYCFRLTRDNVWSFKKLG